MTEALEQKSWPDNTVLDNDSCTDGVDEDDKIIDALRGYTILSEDLTLPYNPNKLWSRIKYYLKTLVVVNPRLYSLFLLYRSIGPRLFVILDMYTDTLVTLQLFATVVTNNSNNSNNAQRSQALLLLILSILFLAFPFIMVWTASLRFIQKSKYVNNQFNANTNKGKLANVLLILYLFPPIGCILVTIYEIFWVFWDIYLGISSFIRGKILVVNKDSQVTSIKQFRKVIEFLGESLPQTLLQLYLAFTSDVDDFGVNSRDLAFSLTVSVLNLVYNIYTLRRDAKFHGMSMANYAISVLQLAEIPIVKLVPRLPGIRAGKVKFVNFCGFRIDKESLGPIIEVCLIFV